MKPYLKLLDSLLKYSAVCFGRSYGWYEMGRAAADLNETLFKTT
jgi:hypothetical protein